MTGAATSFLRLVLIQPIGRDAIGLRNAHYVRPDARRTAPVALQASTTTPTYRSRVATERH
jgi:hypothetical protein